MSQLKKRDRPIESKRCNLKILISRPDKIGDVVLALHGAKQIKRSLPGAQVYMHVSDYTRPLVENIKFIDGCVRFKEDLKPYHFDVVIDLMAKFDTARHYAAQGIRRKIGNSARWFSFLYDERTLVRRSYARVNEAEYNWRLLQLIDPKLKSIKLEESLSIDDFKVITPYTRSKPYLILMPGATVSAVPFPESSWIKLAKELANQNQDKDVVFLGGPAEEEIFKKLSAALSDIPNITFEKPIGFDNLLGVLKNAAGYVGPSTGVTHLASALGLNGIGLYPAIQSMHPRRWQPFKSSLRIKTLSPELGVDELISSLKTELQKPFSKKFKHPISAFIICCNEEQKIERALKSISWCDEILIVDSGSTDKTLEICRKYTDKIITRQWPGHRAQKQFALTQCSHEWILNIDADEEVSPELKNSISEILQDSTPEWDQYGGFRIARIVRFMGRWWDIGGWHPEYRFRLVRKSTTYWGGIDPHEKAILKGEIGTLPGSIYHYTYKNIEDQIHSLNRLSTYSARALVQQGKQFNLINLIANPIVRFLKFYIIKKGFLEGRAGFIVAVHEAFSTFLKYSKLWELTDTNAVEKAEFEVKRPQEKVLKDYSQSTH
jgi:ADP-heptose:LPS heptosyltransferase/glycosyltransferase involved in cell wall biosynthesis